MLMIPIVCVLTTYASVSMHVYMFAFPSTYRDVGVYIYIYIYGCMSALLHVQII